MFGHYDETEPFRSGIKDEIKQPVKGVDITIIGSPLTVAFLAGYSEAIVDRARRP
jgi:hypothetical protein